MANEQTDCNAEEQKLLVDLMKEAGSILSKTLAVLGEGIEQNALTTKEAAEALSNNVSVSVALACDLL